MPPYFHDCMFYVTFYPRWFTTVVRFPNKLLIHRCQHSFSSLQYRCSELPISGIILIGLGMQHQQVCMPEHIYPRPLWSTPYPICRCGVNHLCRNTVNYFSVSAATPPGATHSSGISLRIKFDNSHSDTPFRSNQLINGQVIINSTKSFQIPSLSLRVYFESRTLYWSLEAQGTENKFGQTISGIKNPIALNYDNVIRHEVHRGVIPMSSITLSRSSQIELEAGQNIFLPFSFIIPGKMVITEHSENPYAPRDLCAVERCPPSTLRDSRFGSVQWVAEAIIDLVPSPTPKQDADTLLRQSTDDQVVARVAFPFVPSPEDINPLRNEPFFGQDPEKDLFGSRRLSDEELESEKKAAMGQMKARGGKWEVYVKAIPIGKSNLWSEGAIISTDSLKLPIVLFLKHTGVQSSLKSLFRSTKPKPVHLRRALVTLLRVTSTRGGKEIRPHVENTVVRQQEFLFDSQSGSSMSAGLAIFHEDREPVEVDLTLDLQSEVSSGNHSSIPVKLLTPSFRTPNFQHEFLVTVLISFGEDEVERFPARFAVQVVPPTDVDENQLPSFEYAVGSDMLPPPFDESMISPQAMATGRRVSIYSRVHPWVSGCIFFKSRALVT
ncbi:hypothetical protein AG1IA_05660 [Rhizoctonia solani AG-1 IA]|uniref:Uncharacterized protein n=1 Tax=Thanatephorus cucumeris (strain AG1-IA) TaxID=983506 RepID=L8WVF7_THACA|nr:hypothetical protein AG1IA_05660 [Rhizoctonia solani AG-1 IA]